MYTNWPYLLPFACSLLTTKPPRSFYDQKSELWSIYILPSVGIPVFDLRGIVLREYISLLVSFDTSLPRNPFGFDYQCTPAILDKLSSSWVSERPSKLLGYLRRSRVTCSKHFAYSFVATWNMMKTSVYKTFISSTNGKVSQLLLSFRYTLFQKAL